MMEKFIPDEKRLESIRCNYQSICERVMQAAVKSGRSASDVRLMAVTKTVEPVYINEAISLGANLIGENRVQEFMGKKDELNLDGVEKHLIGRLQTNKVKYIIGEVDMIESVDSFKLAEEISKISQKRNVTTNILVEVNIGKEESKSGIYLENLEELLLKIASLSSIKIKGLMTIPPICENESEVHKYFESMHQSFIDIKEKKLDNINMDILSMGMSGDFEAAIAEGSNLVRVGSSIFGKRNYI